MNGQSYFNMAGDIESLGNRLAGRLSPDEMNFFAELCQSGHPWEDALIDGLAEHAKKTLRATTIVIEVSDTRQLIEGQAKSLGKAIIMEDDLRFLKLPGYLEVKQIPMTDELFAEIPIHTTDEVEGAFAKAGFVEEE